MNCKNHPERVSTFHDCLKWQRVVETVDGREVMTGRCPECAAEFAKTRTSPAIEAANVFHHGDTLVFHPDGTVTKKTPEAKAPEECQCCGGVIAEDGTCPQCASQGCTACVKCGKDADVCECGMKEPS